MKKILGLDLGTTSIGWAVVNEAENAQEQSSIVRLGVRVNPLTTDEQKKFEEGKPITTNADRTLKRSMRRSLQRFKLRRDNLITILKEQGWITGATILSEQGNNSTFQTYRLRAKAATEEISLEELARVLLMINKKRGYKSSRKAESNDEGQLIDGMEVARTLFEQQITPGQYVHRILNEGKKQVPEFYRSDLVAELDKIWSYQQPYHPTILTADFRQQISKLSKSTTTKIFIGKYKTYTLDLKGNRIEKLQALYQLRNDALNRPLSPKELATVVCEVNGAINGSSGYLGDISDRSKELYFNHQTIGQRIIQKLEADPNASLKNQPYYRQDYLDEFKTIWQTQSAFHPELTPELEKRICSRVIFYQRPLRSQKWLVSNCEFEKNHKACPKSSPIFQEFRTLQTLNNLVISNGEGSRPLDDDERKTLLAELRFQSKLKNTEILKLLFPKQKGYSLNYKEIEGNRTMEQLLQKAINILEISGHEMPNLGKMLASQKAEVVKTIFGGLGFDTSWMQMNFTLTGNEFDKQPMFQLWHLLYSYEGDNSNTGDESLVNRLSQMLNMPREYAKIFASAHFEEDYGSLSAKALRKIIPFMQAGHIYSEACALAGYRHSAQSLTREELDNRPLQDHLELLPRNSLRNPVVEKILNQLVNVVNGIIDEYGHPDEVRIELARELKKNAAEREALTQIISKNTKEQERIKKILQTEFGPEYGSRNDIIRYRLWEELSANGNKTLYSNQYIPLEKLFSKEIDIEHIIPQSRFFDDSFSNKTLEYRAINIEKGNATALDYVASKWGQQGVEDYKARVEDLLKKGAISPAKAKKLLMAQADIPEDFIDRDLRNTQYISRKAQEMLRLIARDVTATTGSITDRLRDDWQLVNIMQELNWDKYQRQGLTEIKQGRDGQQIRRIKDWTKRNDHRHHAMDALTIAFTKHSYIQYLNQLNSRQDLKSDAYAIEQKELHRDSDHHLRFNPPMPIDIFRAEAKQHLENILVSIKAKNKVATRNINKTQSAHGHRTKVQLTPRGQLHKETVCAQTRVPHTKEIAVGSKMTAETIALVLNPAYRRALATRLQAFGGDAKKAFTGKNALEKNPIWLDANHSHAVPDRVTIQEYEIIYTVRKPIDENIKLDKVVDPGIRRILQTRLDQFGGDPKKAFSDLDNNPIWQNKAKGISIKSVRYKQLNNAMSLHDKRDKDGNLIFDADGKRIPVDFIDTGNNHHVAIFHDADGNLQEHIVSFLEATARVNQQLPIIDKYYKQDEGWQFLFTMKQNEYFVFPNSSTGFNPIEVDLLNPQNYARISPNLFRVQKLSSKYYVFRHHLETTVEEPNMLRDTTWKRIQSPNYLVGIVKVRINHLGQIVQVGEY
ncbi:MAG: type II CRISPR RNA-guided endonuclease Cas9 [Bacteroidales bacterium]|nr:type II CRISPR RNA-guided endonuclease Cas9 [Bacteroidales bacterium]